MRLVVTTVLMALAFLASTSNALAGIDKTFDWEGSRRNLRVCYDFDKENDKLGDQLLKDIMDEAIMNWNDVKDDTGWEFEVIDDCSQDHEVTIEVGELGRSGGASTSGFPAAGADDRTVSRLTITFDQTPDEGFEWGVNDDDKLNPVRVAKHELTHVMRLDHQGDSGNTTGNLTDPTDANTEGDDVLTPSDDDKDEAKGASTAPIEVASAPVGPGQGTALAVAGFPEDAPSGSPAVGVETSITIGSDAFLTDAVVSFSRTSLYSMPLPFSVPSGIERMVKGVHVDTTGAVGSPDIDGDALVTVVIPYEDGAEGEGFLIDIADLDYSPIRESSLQPYVYDPLAQAWTRLNPFALGGSYTLDTSNDVAEVSFPASLLYEYPNIDDPTIGTLFLSISGAPSGVGGIAEISVDGRLSSTEREAGSGVSTVAYAALALALSAIVVAGGGLYVRRRWLDRGE